MFQEVEYQGVKFPAQLDTPYAVAQVLNQEPGKLRAKDLRDGKNNTYEPMHMKTNNLHRQKQRRRSASQ